MKSNLIISNIVGLLLFILIIMPIFTEIESSVITLLMFVLGTIAYGMSFLKTTNFSLNFKYTIFNLLLLLLGILNLYYTNILNILAYLNTFFVYGGLGLLILNYRPNQKILKILNLFLIAFFFISIILGSDPNLILIYSRNYISVVLMYSISLLFIAYDGEVTSTNVLFYLFAALIVSIMAVGRGGIISFTVAVIAYLLFLYSKQRSRNYLWLIFITTLIVMVLLIFIIPNMEEIFPQFYQRSVSQEPRVDIWESYWDSISGKPGQVLIGSQSQFFSTRYGYFDNLHNSYLTVHHRYGLLGVVFLITGLLRTLIFSIKQREYNILTMIILVIVRSMFDTTFGMFHGDFLIFYIIFYPDFKLKEIINYEMQT